jgi:hypothetical protein
VYFNFKKDILHVAWGTLGPSPGRLGRKISQEELDKVQRLVLDELSLVKHANEDMRELVKLPKLDELILLCDPRRDVFDQRDGSLFGYDEMMSFAAVVEGDGENQWPFIWCSKSPRGEVYCSSCSSRHWWFDRWDRLSLSGQKMKWGEMSRCLKMTFFNDTDD